MKQKITLFFLLLIYLPTFGQQKSSFKYVFTVGYGYFDLFRETENKKQFFFSKGEFNYRRTLVGPIYLKFEKNINRRLGLAMAFGYERFTYNADFNMYKTVNEGKNGYYTNIKFIELGDSIVDQKIVHEENIYSSFSSTLRLNFYFYNKPYFQFYMGIGISYRMNIAESNSNMHAQYPETIKYSRRLMGGYINHAYLFPIGGEVTFGFRGYFYKNLGFYTELGLAKSFIQMGLCYKVQ